jgi:hypothetical protein
MKASDLIKELAAKQGIHAKRCGVCGAEEIVTNMVDVALFPHQPPNAFEFVCPTDREHVPIEERRAYCAEAR